MKRKVTKAVFPVAGMGTRFLPATKSIPKEIMTLVDRPLIQYAIDEARAAGIKEFIFVTSRGKSALEDYFDHAHELESKLRKSGKEDLLQTLKETNMESGAIAYIRQHKALGLGHAVWCARRLIANEPFAVILPDDVIAAEKPCLQQMVEAYEETGGNMVAAMEVALSCNLMSGGDKRRSVDLSPNSPARPSTKKTHTSSPKRKKSKAKGLQQAAMDVKKHYYPSERKRRNEHLATVEEEQEWQVNGLARGDGRGHLTVVRLLGFIQVKLGVQTPPLLVVLVDALATDGELDVAQEDVTKPVQPTELLAGGDSDVGQGHVEVHLVDKVTVAGKHAGHLAPEIGSAVELLGNALHGEVCVTPEDKLPVGDLRISCQVNVLCTKGYELE